MKVLAIVQGVEKGFEKVGEGVVHVVEVIGHCAADLEKLLADEKPLQPQIKSGLVQLIGDGEAVVTAVVAAAGAEGTNVVLDAAGLAAVQKFAKDFVAFGPVLKQLVAIAQADLK